MNGLIKPIRGLPSIKRCSYIFDYSLPDPPKAEPVTEFRDLEGNGVMVEVTNHGYNPSFNYHKVRLDIWDHFSDYGKGTINHAFGGMVSSYEYKDDSVYGCYIKQLTLEEWKEFAMHTLTNALWYWDAAENRK